MDVASLKGLPVWEWPKNAGEIFLGVAMDKENDAADRLLAMEYAGDPTAINNETPGASDIPATGDPMLLSPLKGIHPDLPAIPKPRHHTTSPWAEKQ